MEVVVTTFTNPFSFFCIPKSENIDAVYLTDNTVEQQFNKTKFEVSDVNHGQYIAVLWKNKWTRGVISMETQLLIWLVDYGFYLRPNDKTVYIDLSVEYRKYPSKVFEASIHGVIPIDKILTHDIRIDNAITTVWNKGTTEKAQTLIRNAKKTLFYPLALLSTKNNDVVLGDLYLQSEDDQLKNFADVLEEWPVFLNKDKDVYIKNLVHFYNNRRKHRACLLRPDIGFKTPIITLETPLDEYIAICAKMSELTKHKECEVHATDGSTVLDMQNKYSKEKKSYKLTHEEINNYANMYIRVHGREFNVLNILINKIRDLNMCERYKDHDLKSIGCCISVRNPKRT